MRKDALPSSSCNSEEILRRATRSGSSRLPSGLRSKYTWSLPCSSLMGYLIGSSLYNWLNQMPQRELQGRLQVGFKALGLIVQGSSIRGP